MTFLRRFLLDLGGVSSVAVLALGLSGVASADDLTTLANPGDLGFSAARLAQIAPWYQVRFDAFSPPEGLVPGAVIAIARGGKLAYLQAIGFQDRARTIPMKTDSIFWIASMSKPVTSVAAMILVDDGKLDLDAPVARYLPEFQGRASRIPEDGRRHRQHGIWHRPARTPKTADDDSRSVAPYLGSHLSRIGFCVSGARHSKRNCRFRYPNDAFALQLDRRESIQTRRDAGGFRFCSGSPAARPSARRSLGIWLERRRPRAGRSKWHLASRSTNSCRAVSLRRCTWSTLAFTCRKPSSTASSMLPC